MNGRIKIGLALGVFALLGILVVGLKGDSEEEEIHDRLNALLVVLEKTNANEGKLQTLAAAKKAGSYFVEYPSLEILPSWPIIAERDKFVAYIAQSRALIDSVELACRNRQLVIFENKRQAEMLFTGKIDAKTAKGNEGYSKRYRMEWVLKEGEWLIERIELIS